MRKSSTLAMAITVIAASHSAADIFTLDFEGLGDVDQILEFYNGGTSSQGFSGINYGVSFSDSPFGLIHHDAGGTGYFENEPSPSTIAMVDNGNGDEFIINVAGGFEMGFAIWYNYRHSQIGSLEIYDDLNAEGHLLASRDLLQNDNGSADVWGFITLEFDSIAKSVRFAGTENVFLLDDMTFGAIPTPGALCLLIIAPIAGKRRRRN